jgi:transaldolase/glucose-6-phosphate isomerase
MNPLQQLTACGQSPWLDYLTRSLMASGKLQTMIDRDGLKGMTSNPSIFEKAIGESDEYADAIKSFQAGGDHSISDIYEHLAIADIQAAADVLRSVFDETDGRDGYVSLECSPYLANDTAGTLVEARRLWAAVDRPNLMVKVPATPAGLPAIRQLIGEGLNINVTLLFAVDVYEAVAEAYIGGLEDWAASGGDVRRPASVASIFISRIDVAVDKRLAGFADQGLAKSLRGKAGIANAKLAYERYQALFAGPRWATLAKAGGRTQRLLWASTSPKDPAYKDTLYVEALIGRDTVDTLPPATLDAFRDHGEAVADAIEADVEDARATIATLERNGISVKAVTDELVVDGVQQFADSFDKLFAAVAGHRRTLAEGKSPRLDIQFGSSEMTAAYEDEVEVWRREGRIRKLWALDKFLWTGADEDQWCGWLTVADDELAGVEALERFAADVRDAGTTAVVLLGMGGSSLGAEALGETLGGQPGALALHILDSTDPAQIRTLEQAIHLKTTLFIVSSKSGSTLEPNLFVDYFFHELSAKVGDKAGRQFVAVTDPGSSLETRAKAMGFGHIFYGVPSIGGRYSVLSKFGLAPAAAMGLDVRRLLQAALPMVRSCGPDVPPAENPGVLLGLALGVAATRFGRDKVTLIASPGIADLGAWLEQLLAESTGKQDRGLMPLAGEPLAAPDLYGHDRFFVYLELQGGADPAQRRAVEAIENAGHPVARILVEDVWHVGQEFVRWEIATAAAGSVIRINPFNQPDVEASKDKTHALMDAYETSQIRLPENPVFSENGLTLYADGPNVAELGGQNSLPAYLKSHLGRVRPGDYVALLAYVERNDAHTQALTAMRVAVRDQTHAATCLGFGPRFQHSTGQAFKGGRNDGVFMQITCDDPHDLDAPGHGYSFGVVKQAQASGDLGVLEDRGRRALRIHLTDVNTGLRDLGLALTTALEQGR